MSYQPPGPNCYRLTRGTRVAFQEERAVAICDYPLRAVRVSLTAARLLELCREQSTCEELATQLGSSTRKVRALCEQLHWKGLLEAGPPPAPSSWPRVSIIIPSHNRAAQLTRCLRALFDLDYPADHLEILVVDDASTDTTSSMLARLVQESTAQERSVRVLHHSTQQGVGISRNAGAGAAQHEILAYIDSDCVATSNWLAELVPAFQDTRIAAVGGIIRAFERVSTLGRYEDVRSSLYMGNRPQQVLPEGPLTYLPTANLLVRRATWQRLGGFTPLTFGEDVDFCRRLLSTGAHMLYLPQGTVYHDYRTTWAAFILTRISYASAEAALLRLHPQERRILLLPPEQTTFATMAIGSLMFSSRAARKPHKPRSLSASTGMSLAALILTFLGAFRRWHKVREQSIPIKPLAVLHATIRGHLAYTYHTARHLTRYYTLPIFLLGLLIPPLLVLALILCSTVISVDYIRLRPDMGLGQYALCALLDDCAYEVGVVIGCIRHGSWKPLVPIVRRNKSSM